MFILIEKLKKQLSEKLPGKEVQYSMAPVARNILPAGNLNQKAGVLFLLYPYKGEFFIVFIKRTEYNGAHSGQVSLPGGKFETKDKTLKNTALRESHEEIGIHPDEIIIIGQLTPLEIPISNFEVFPYVGFTRKKPDFKPDPSEVEYLIHVSLSKLTNPSIRKSKIMTVREFTGAIPYFDISEDFIWGATAMMLAEFIEVLRLSGYPPQK